MEIPAKKERLTLYIDSAVKEELKRQAKESGVSASALVSMLISERAREDRARLRYSTDDE